MWRWDRGDMMDGSGGGTLLVVLVVLVLLLQVVMLVLQLTAPARATRPDAAEGTARGLLDERLARGEVTPEEYRTARTLLGP